MKRSDKDLFVCVALSFALFIRHHASVGRFLTAAAVSGIVITFTVCLSAALIAIFKYQGTACPEPSPDSSASHAGCRQRTCTSTMNFLAPEYMVIMFIIAYFSHLVWCLRSVFERMQLRWQSATEDTLEPGWESLSSLSRPNSPFFEQSGNSVSSSQIQNTSNNDEISSLLVSNMNGVQDSKWSGCVLLF
jgi:hypothetical protein